MCKCVMLSIRMSACLGRSDAGVYVHKPSTTIKLMCPYADLFVNSLPQLIPPASVIFIPTGGDDRDVQGAAGSRLRIVHANFY